MESEAETLVFYSCGCAVLQAVSYSSAENLVQLKDRHATINAQEQTVSLLKAGYDFPFVIEAFTLELSPMAVLQEAYPDGIRLNH